MTVSDHPTRSDAIARGDLAESLVPVAAELAFTVRTEDREGIGAWLDAHGITEPAARNLLVVAAAGWPVDATNEDTLNWVTWDEFGETLEQTIPLLPRCPEPALDVSLPVPAQPGAGTVIRQARTEAGLSQKALAAKAGVGPRTVRAWETGTQAVRQGHWVMLQIVLGPLGIVRPEASQEQQRGEAA